MIPTPVFPRHRAEEAAHPLGTQRFVSTADPGWLVSLIEEAERYQCAIRECLVIRHASQGTLTPAQAHECFIQFYPLLETFPQWVSLHLKKTSDHETRSLLERYARITKWQAHQWILMAEGFGVCRQRLFETPIRLKVGALNQYLWEVNRRQSIADGVMALGYALGDAMRVIAPSLLNGFKQYEQHIGIVLNRYAYAWVRSHAQSNAVFMYESLEMTKRHVSTTAEQNAVRDVVMKSLELLLMALEECGAEYDPCDCYRHAHYAAA